MKTCAKLAITCILATAFAPSLFAQLSIPSDGSDGALVAATNMNIDLSQAVTGSWTNAGTGKGIYDASKWAVVFKYSSVSISNGATLTFSNHPTHAPVVWLVNGDVTINGNLSLDGQNATADAVNLPEPGPGGFRGGALATGGYSIGGGFGPGGYYLESGSYASNHPYGNLQIVPLIGGSGGSAANFNTATPNGAGGGGAILIAASGTITVNGYCHANGGGGNSYQGSGGAVRMIASQILGNGTIYAVMQSFNNAFQGRIRLETTNLSSALTLNPITAAAPPLPLTIWPAPDAPTVQVTSISKSIGNVNVPADPKAAMAASGDDMTLTTTNAVTIRLQTSNFPTNGMVNVYIKPRNSSQSILPASFVSGTIVSANWQLVTPFGFPLNHTVIQARAVVP